MKVQAKEKIDDKLIFTIDPKEVEINKDMPRQRQDMGKIQDMIDSITSFGQLQPIVINRDKTLIFGGRRLAACLMLDRKVRACYKDTIDPLLMRELEFEENHQRKALTPAEEAFAIEELVKLKQEKYGKPTQGKTGGYTLEHAAKMIGKTKGNVIESLQMAEMLRSFPDLSKAKTKSEIKKAYKGMQRVQDNIVALSEYETKSKDIKMLFSLENEDMKKHILTQEDGKYDLILTDPPYGINIDKIGMTVGVQTGGELTNTATKYDDSENNAIELIQILAKEGYRITKEDGHMYMFCGRDRHIFNMVYDIVVAAGWLVLKWPIAWIKRNSGQNNQPELWPSSCYEAILFARKPKSRLLRLGCPDWIQCDRVPSGQKIHQAEKPVGLIKELISRVAMPGDCLYDPFVGSGAILDTACQMSLFPTGCELSLESYATAIARLSQFKKSEKGIPKGGDK